VENFSDTKGGLVLSVGYGEAGNNRPTCGARDTGAARRVIKKTHYCVHVTRQMSKSWRRSCTLQEYFSKLVEGRKPSKKASDHVWMRRIKQYMLFADLEKQLKEP